MDMLVEDLFGFLDKVLGLSTISNNAILLFSAGIVFTISTLLLIYGEKDSSSPNIKFISRTKSSVPFLGILSIFSIVILIVGYIESLISLEVTWTLIVGLVFSIINFIIILVIFPKLSRASTLFTALFFLNATLFVTFFSSHVLINGVDAGETTTDTLQIFVMGSFRFSRHAGWYDLAPVDAIEKNFLLHIMGINDPYDPVTTTIIYVCLSVFTILYLFAYIKKIDRTDIGRHYALAMLLMAVNPYAFLITASTPPTNFSIALSLASIIAINSLLFNRRDAYRTPPAILIGLFSTVATLSHPMSLMILLYLIGVAFYAMVTRSWGLLKRTFHVMEIWALPYLIKASYTAAFYGYKGLLDMLIEGLMQTLYEWRTLKLEVIYYGGQSPPKSTLFSFAAFPGIMASVFLVELSKWIRRRNADLLTLAVIASSIISTILSVIINIVSSNSRYIGLPAITLGAFQVLVYLTRNKAVKPQNIGIAVLLGFIAITTILSPNSMIEQYNVFTGGRWPRIENFIMAQKLFSLIDYGYIINVFNGLEKAKLTLYLPNDILLYGHPYHHIENMIVEKILIPGIINTRSYWDFYGRLFLKYEYRKSLETFSDTNVVFSGWKWVLTWD